LSTGDSIYLFTDGYADQFGGPNGKKLMYKPFKKLLISIWERPMPQQKDELLTKFNQWKGKLEQVDDVCIAGIKIT
jgi:serine phosphatase RsbU (regulator of sigma subunit)